ncbi:hypothetical protein BOX15_Mlig013244g1 [Macrostomum lignano]|uniref:Protein phosphatase n=1 Tax=Macrostomum lignano TaxID=282301 RepID=A0A267GA19_9PLAT|nr:hypothetical protein BOX15_Mlig013244g1 [Macrostomum lignano]
MTQQLTGSIRKFASSALQLCASGRPALYKLQQQQQKRGEGNEAELSMVKLGLGQSGVRQIGEDAILIGQTGGDCDAEFSYFGVADGVGGWRDQGIDPGEASLALLDGCRSVFDASTSLKELLTRAHGDLLNSRRDLIGSTTVCLARYSTETRRLDVANLGDSGLCVMDAEFQLRMRTQFQSNMGGVFNCPMQLAFPKALSGQYPKPGECELYSIVLEPGDVVLMATDGLWDNLYQKTIEEIFRHAFQASRIKVSEPKTAAAAQPTKSTVDESAEVETEASPPLEAASRILVDAATYLSAEQSYFSPFCQSAKDAGLKYVGGKEDDISVVLARLCPSQADVSTPKAKL